MRVRHYAQKKDEQTKLTLMVLSLVKSVPFLTWTVGGNRCFAVESKGRSYQA